MADSSNKDLIWECLRHNNCFLRKFNGEPTNLTHQHKKRFSGLMGTGVGVVVVNRKVRLVKSNGKSKQPKCNKQTIRVGVNPDIALKKVSKAILYYRPDLVTEAQKVVDKRVKMHLNA